VEFLKVTTISSVVDALGAKTVTEVVKLRFGGERECPQQAAVASKSFILIQFLAAAEASCEPQAAATS